MSAIRGIPAKRRITVASYVDATWWGLSLLAFAAGSSTETMTYWIGPCATLLAVWTLAPFSERWLWLRPRFSILLGFGFLCLLQGLNHFLQDRDILLFLGDSLAGFIPATLHRRKQGLGYWLAFLTSFFLALAAVVAEGEINAYFFFIAFLAVGAANLNAAHLLQLTGPTQARIQELSPRYFRQFSTSALAGFGVGAFIFLAFPREYSWVNPWGLREKNRQLGYTNTISLDGQSISGDSSALAFTVESPDPAFLALFSRDLYFRGNIVDKFDGIHWSYPERKLRPFRSDRDLRLATSHVRGVQRLKIYREGSTTTNIFYPQILRGLDLPWSRIGGVAADQNGNLSRTRADAFPFIYDVLVSNPSFPDLKGSLRDLAGEVANYDGAGDAPFRPTAAELRRALEIPAAIRDAAYFVNWRTEIRVDPTKDSLFQTLNKLKKHFQKKFKATLIHDMPEKRAFEYFLSTERKGHCEYFSTAATLFLRSQGIPARVVLGYFGGAFNGVSKVTEIRESNAHAWVEVFVPDKGWFAFDPTPLVPPAPQWAISNFIRSYYSASRFWFNRYVADYNGKTQVALIQSFSIHRLGRDTASKSMQGWIILLGVTLLSGGALSLVATYRRRRRQQNDLPKYYRVFLWRAERAGFRKGLGESHSAFLNRIVASGNSAGSNEAMIKDLARALELDLYSQFRTPETYRRGLTQKLRTVKLNTGRAFQVSNTPERAAEKIPRI